MKKHLLSLLVAAIVALPAAASRSVVTLNDGWLFSTVDPSGVESPPMAVTVPHDCAIAGPFDPAIDLQRVAVKQNGESVETLKTGRTGGLPFIGRFIYRRPLNIADTAGRRLTLLFDGAMSNAKVSLNGEQLIFWPNGYNAFYVDLTGHVNPGANELEIELENEPQSSRWYPGAGLYRNVHLISTGRVHIPVWGTCVTTPSVDAARASITLDIDIAGTTRADNVRVVTCILDPDGREVARADNIYVPRGQHHRQQFVVDNPRLWSPDTPAIYTALTTLSVDSTVVDTYQTPFGIRRLEFIPSLGFFLNGVETKFHGVCNHHDLGPLGAAVNRSAIRHRLSLLKDMGVNAIRTSHNMPSPELVELCDRMGLMLMVEAFDDWGYRPKSPNGYSRHFATRALDDIDNMVRHYRNNPSVVMWSIGNEVPSQWSKTGVDELLMLQDRVHQLDPTRPVTCGMDGIGGVLKNGFAASLDIPGFNYKPQYYEQAYNTLPQRLILGSETASTVSSRGVYHFPVAFDQHRVVIDPSGQSSSYDDESCKWSNTPDIDFFMDNQPWVIGQFVWTGFDYLGEPSPYDTDFWPNHSSLFGIIDLASLPKDRYYLYRSRWNRHSPTLHLLPHWTWPGREGLVTPVFVYTSYPRAELFVNGVSQGIRQFNDSTLQTRYRLMWPDVIYQPGEITVVAYTDEGLEADRRSIHTAGRPSRLHLQAHRDTLEDTGDDMAYITVTVVDSDGNPVPTDSRRVRFKVDGAGTFEATANGDPRCLLPFRRPEMDLFSGAATLIVRSATTPGTLRVTATAPGLKSATITIPVNPTPSPN